MEWITRAADKAGAFGSIVSAASCPGCYPALAGLGTAMGLGFLAGYDGLLIDTLLPLFAAIALIANALGWLRHRQWHRSALGMIGPAMVLAAARLFFGQRWAADLLYAGLALMFSVSLWDLLSPANKRCGADGCEAGQLAP
jgi:mercuric ion transport protein